MFFRPHRRVITILFGVLINSCCLHLSFAQTSNADNNRDRQQASHEEQSAPNTPNPAIQAVEPHRANPDANRDRGKQEGIKPQNLPQPSGVPVEGLLRFLRRTDRFFSNHAQAFQAIGNLSQAFFALILLLVAAKQVSIAKRQTEISAESREIALAALGRPLVLFEFVSHNFDEWRAGKDWLRFEFRFINYGKGPAFISMIYAHAFLSYGPRPPDVDEGGLIRNGIIRPFPSADTFAREMFFSGTGVRFARSEGQMAGAEWDKSTSLTLKEGEASPKFEKTIPFPALDLSDHTPGVQINRILHKLTGIDGYVRPWMIGRIYYNALVGTSHYTTFCICGERDGSVGRWDPRPYTEQT